jgi:hypothetical protein
MWRFLSLFFGLSVCVNAIGFGLEARVRRQDFLVPEDAEIRIAVRELRVDLPENGPPLLLIHGARVPGIAWFDLDVPGGSLAADLAAQGFAVYCDGRAGRRPGRRECSNPPTGGQRWSARMRRPGI